MIILLLRSPFHFYILGLDGRNLCMSPKFIQLFDLINEEGIVGWMGKTCSFINLKSSSIDPCNISPTELRKILKLSLLMEESALKSHTMELCCREQTIAACHFLLNFSLGCL